MIFNIKKNLNIIICCIIFFSLIISTNSARRKPHKDFHPYNIQFDYSNLKGKLNDDTKKILKDEMEMAGQFLSKLIYNDNKRTTIYFTEDTLKHCYDKSISFKTKDFEYDNIDLLIIPILADKEKRSIFEGFICKQYNLQLTYLAILEISKNYAERLIKIDTYLLRLKLLHALTNIIGFDKSLLNKETLSNSYFIVPKYVTDNFWYSQTIKKYYNFTNIQMPKIRVIDEIRSSYRKYWGEEIIVPDYMNEIIKGNYMITELTIYLLKDFSFLRINKCDFELFNNKECFRLDKKCHSFNDLYYNYFIDYHYEKDKNNGKIKIKCHLNTDINLRHHQCGVIEGNLVNDLISKKYCINYQLSNKKKVNNENDIYHVPEFDEMDYQKIQLVSPSKYCPNKHPRTVFFKPLHFPPENGDENLDRQLIKSLEEHEAREKRKFKVEEVTLTNKKYFLSFLTYTNYMLIVQTLKGNGLVRSYLQNGNHNMLCVPPYKFDIELVHKYQYFYKRGGQVGISNKFNLHKNYDKMKSLFPKDYNYMTETYSYPEKKEIIDKKFQNYRQSKNNLWLVKPKSSSEGRGIHMFESLKSEKGSYLITKYIENPHLIYGKKYDFRIYILITSVNPLSIYIYRQGLVRIASEKYSLDANKLTSRYIHLTNTVVNKANKEYIFNDSIDSELGNKWSLKAYQKYCEKMGIDFEMIFDGIKDIAIKTILSINDKLNKGEEVKYTHKNFYHRNYHNLFGFDFILDDDFNVYLLEVNDGPSLSLYDNMDRDIKTKLMADTFNLIGIVPFAHDETQKPMDEVYEYNNRREEEVDYALCEFSRPKGNYERIFPVKNHIEKYKNLFTIITEENKLLWEKIENMEDFN